MIEIARSILQNIPGFQKWVQINPLAKSCSGKSRYQVLLSDCKLVLLEVIPFSQSENYRLIDDYTQAVQRAGVLMPELLSCGFCMEHMCFYLLRNWLPGESLDKMLDGLEPDQQYELGVLAGIQLKRLHCLQTDNQACFSGQADQKTDLGKMLEVLEDATYSGTVLKPLHISFVRQHLLLIEKCSQTPIHGDMKLNHLIQSEQKLFLIDPGPVRVGDPLSDLAGLLYEITKAKQPFAQGLLDCYLGLNTAKEDFRRICLLCILKMAERIRTSRVDASRWASTWLGSGQNLEKEYPGFYKPK